MAQEKPSIFRKEAREYYLHLRRQEGDVQRLPSEGMQWMYWALTALAGVAGLFSMVATVPRYVSGPAQVRSVSSEGSAAYVVEALLPAANRANLLPGMPIWIELDGKHSESLKLPIESVDEQALSPPVDSPKGAWVLVRARLSSGESAPPRPRLALSEGMSARAEVAVQTEPLLFALIQQLKALHSHDG